MYYFASRYRVSKESSKLRKSSKLYILFRASVFVEKLSEENLVDYKLGADFHAKSRLIDSNLR